MEKKVPTKKISIESDETTLELEVYSWFTQEEENEYALMVVDKKNYSIDPKTGEEVRNLTPETVVELRRYLVEHMLKSHTWVEFNVLAPEIRTAIVDKLVEVRNDNDKKK